MNKFYYAAVVVDGEGAGTATFYLRDFPSTAGNLRMAKKRSGATNIRSKLPLVIGGRTGGSRHGWDGWWTVRA